MNNSIAIRKTLKEYGLLSIGTFLIALAVKQYMIPCRIITGSVSGLALLLHEIIRLDDSLLVLVLNLLCLLIGTINLGKKFGVRSIFVSLMLPIMMKLIPDRQLLSGSHVGEVMLFLSLLTTGQCILFSLDTSSGGLDTIAEVLAKKTALPLGLMISLLGVGVALLTIYIYGIEVAISGSLITMLNGLLINIVSHAGNISFTKIRKLIGQA